jgi:2-oxoglutarate ferredoxin oxidoreductase subunit alpha
MKSVPERSIETLDRVVIRFAGDSGDGMQLVGTQFTNASAIFGNDISTLPDFPAEIRAPAGTLAGVSGFQVNFSSEEIHTPGDLVKGLIAMNPAALAANLADVEAGGIVIVNEDEFTSNNLKKAGYAVNPLDDDTLKGYRLHKIPISKLNLEAVKESEMSTKGKERCKNFFALGLVCWLFGRPIEPTLKWIEQKFSRKPEVAEANRNALQAGHAFGETTEIFQTIYQVNKAKLSPGLYRKISGNEATALGMVVAAHLAGKELFYGSYPITPASDILHDLSRLKRFNVKTYQAEDEIAAMGSVIGAAFAGVLGMTGTSGPGLALKGEALGLAIAAELPVVVINVQRGGPSTGLPTKTEQSDLLLAMYGRNGDCPVCIVAPSTPGECFDMAIEAWRIAIRHMIPVIYLSDGYLANGSEPWEVPEIDKLAKIKVTHPTNGNGEFHPYARNEDLSRPWAIPGTAGLEHRIGGLERQDITGNVSYDPENHEHMTHLRAEKVRKIANHIPDLTVDGPASGDLLVVGWGSTYGALTTAVKACQKQGLSVGHAHLRYLNPFPKNTEQVLQSYKRILVPEMNAGQLILLLRGMFDVKAISHTKIQGKPFTISEIQDKIEQLLAGEA